MAKRYSSTEIWDEDWFLEMPIEYKLFWFYILSSCDHGGFFKVNLKLFCALNSVEIDSKKAVKFFNEGKDRIRVINNSVWLIEDFFSFQYGHHFNSKNKVHESVERLWKKHNISPKSIKGLDWGLNGVK